MRFKIQYKISLIITLTVAVILIGIFYYLNNSLTQDAYNRIHTSLAKETALVRTYLNQTFKGNQSIKFYDQMADQIGKDLNLRATIITLNGKVLGDSKLTTEQVKNVENHLYRPEVQEAINTGYGESHRFSTTVQMDMLYIANIFESDEAKGIIRLALPLAEIALITDELKNLLFAALFIGFLISIVLGVGASFFVSSPIKRIANIATSIAQGDYTQRTNIRSNDEIEDLGKSINNMSEQIHSRIDEIVSNKSRFEAILLSMFEGVIVIDDHGNILLMNDTLKNLLRIESDPIGKKPLEVIRNIEIQEMIEKILKNKSQVESIEISTLLPDEKTFQVHATTIIRDQEIKGAVMVFHDITELRKLENIRRDFVANVSHELKTPITNIKGYTETLLDGALEDKENARDFLEIISTDTQRLTQLVDDLLDLSMIESGKFDLDIKELDIESIIDRVLLGCKKRINDKKITVKKDIPKKLSKFKGDEKSIAQVMLNLIDNAIKYNVDGGEIFIKAADADGFVQVQVRDSGIGIPKDDLPRLFERFYRVDKARSRELGGTGLGLAIAKHIIQNHQGEIIVQSEIDRGTTFTINLPKA